MLLLFEKLITEPFLRVVKSGAVIWIFDGKIDKAKKIIKKINKVNERFEYVILPPGNGWFLLWYLKLKNIQIISCKQNMGMVECMEWVKSIYMKFLHLKWLKKRSRKFRLLLYLISTVNP